jgi:hypothetical protein
MQEFPSMTQFHGMPPDLVATNQFTNQISQMTSGILAGIERWPLDN